MPPKIKSIRQVSVAARQIDLPDRNSVGLRERNKIDKLKRISAAAIKLFGRDGYEGTTLRDIAREADVALATLSIYARDKRDVVLLIFNQVIPPLLDLGHQNVHPGASLSDNLVAFFDPCYRAYVSDLTLYRVVLGQVYNGPNRVHAEENDMIRIELLGHVTRIIELAIANGECRKDTDIAIQSRSFFYIYFTAVRVWLFQEQPDLAQGFAMLRTLFAQHVRGIAVGT